MKALRCSSPQKTEDEEEKHPIVTDHHDYGRNVRQRWSRHRA